MKKSNFTVDGKYYLINLIDFYELLSIINENLDFD